MKGVLYKGHDMGLKLANSYGLLVALSIIDISIRKDTQ